MDFNKARMTSSLGSGITRSVIKNNIIKKVSYFSMLIMLTGCKVYNTSFGCPDAKGLACMSMTEVDKRINSGEIEEVKKSNCKGRSCARQSKNLDIKPQMKSRRSLDAAYIKGGENDSGVKIEGVINVE